MNRNSIKIRDLRYLLDGIPKTLDNCNVIMSSDPEGNSYSGFGGYAIMKFIDGDVYSADDPDAPKEAKDVLCLWPS